MHDLVPNSEAKSGCPDEKGDNESTGDYHLLAVLLFMCVCMSAKCDDDKITHLSGCAYRVAPVTVFGNPDRV